MPFGSGLALLLIEELPGLGALVELGEARLPGHAPAPQDRPLEEGPERLQRAEHQPIDAIEKTELEDVGAQEAPRRAADHLQDARAPVVAPALSRAPHAVLGDAVHVLGEV